MKNPYIILLIAVICTIRFSAQTLKPSQTHAIVNMLIVNENDKPISEKVELVSKKTSKTYKGISNINGMVGLKVPINDTYILNISNVKEYLVFEIPDEPFYKLNYKIEYKASTFFTLGMSLIKLQVLYNSGKPLPNEKVTFKNLETLIEYTSKTGQDGKLSLELPYNAKYNISFEDAPDYDRFQLPKRENYIFDYKVNFDGSGNGNHYPTMENGLLIFSYLNLDDKPLSNEIFEVVSKKRKKSYSVKTNKEGKAYLLVPLGDKYTISSKCFKNFKICNFPDTLGLLYSEVELIAISSAEFELRQKDREELLRIRDSIYQANLKEYQANLKDFELQFTNPLQYTVNEVEKRVIKAKKELDISPSYFEKVKNTINSVLYRQRNRWKNKIIITDVTCSMDRYLEEVYLWHALELNSNNKNEYIFFNDGDGKAQYQKIDGNTGGLHYTNSVVLDSVISRAFDAQSFGCSGDGPENDFEAILKGIEYRDSRKEIILIADNYSDVRDYSLLEEIDVPIRIILCGVDNHVNEQYLNLAYHSKGSVHSIEEDLDMLKRLPYDTEIKFLGKTYIYTKGGFIYKNDF